MHGQAARAPKGRRVMVGAVVLSCLLAGLLGFLYLLIPNLALSARVARVAV